MEKRFNQNPSSGESFTIHIDINKASDREIK